MLAAPRKFSWENAFIDLSMADHDAVAAAAEEAKVVAEAVAAAEAVSGDRLKACCSMCSASEVHCNMHICRMSDGRELLPH